MLEFDFLFDKEGLLYEQAMDKFRALALFAVSQPTPPIEIFEFIKNHSLSFASDILSTNKVQTKTLRNLEAEWEKLKEEYGLNKSFLENARNNQISASEGFWQMSRYLGQFPDIVNSINTFNPDQIVCAAASGCVIGEYISLLLQRVSHKNTPVVHAIFQRNRKTPTKAFFPPDFTSSGKRYLIVEDAVNEPHTITAILKEIQNFEPDPNISLFALQIENNQEVNPLLRSMNTVFCFVEE